MLWQPKTVLGWKASLLPSPCALGATCAMPRRRCRPAIVAGHALGIGRQLCSLPPRHRPPPPRRREPAPPSLAFSLVLLGNGSIMSNSCSTSIMQGGVLSWVKCQVDHSGRPCTARGRPAKLPYGGHGGMTTVRASLAVAPAALLQLGVTVQVCPGRMGSEGKVSPGRVHLPGRRHAAHHRNPKAPAHLAAQRADGLVRCRGAARGNGQLRLGREKEGRGQKGGWVAAWLAGLSHACTERQGASSPAAAGETHLLAAHKVSCGAAHLLQESKISLQIACTCMGGQSRTGGVGELRSPLISDSPQHTHSHCAAWQRSLLPPSSAAKSHEAIMVFGPGVATLNG